MIFFTTKNTIGIEILNSKFTNQTSYLKLLTGQIGWKARLAGRPDWLEGQIGWKARLAGRPDWLEGQIS